MIVVCDAQTKTCNKCGASKLRTEFYRDSAASDGLKNTCKDCEKSRLPKDVISFRHWKKSLRRRGTSVEAYQELYDVQGGVCSRCGTDKPGGGNTHLCVVFSASGELSELVCVSCNLSIRQQKHSVYRTVNGVREKQCSKCLQWKPASEYYRNPQPNRPHALTSACHACERQRKTSLEGRANVRKASRKSQLKRYGLSPEDYQSMYMQQSGCCLICGLTEEKLQVDHCHATGKVRGLLCLLCNTMLGKAHDSPEILRAAANYLERNSHQ